MQRDCAVIVVPQSAGAVTTSDRIMLLAGSGYPVVRYHSLVVDEATLPDALAPIAWTTGATRAVRPAKSAPAVDLAAKQQQQPHGAGILMGLAHRTLPHYGVQFHPESIATSFGTALLSNFRDLTAASQGPPVPRPLAGPQLNGGCPSYPESAVVTHSKSPGLWRRCKAYDALMNAGHSCSEVEAKFVASTELDVRWHCMPGVLRHANHGERIFRTLYGHSRGEDTFWLDRCHIRRLQMLWAFTV